MAETPNRIALHPLRIDLRTWDVPRVMEIVLERLPHMSLEKALLSGWENRGLPTPSTVRNWCDRDPQLAAQVARARQQRAANLVEEATEIADTPPDRNERTGGMDSAYVRWQEQRINQRRWIAERLDRAAFGQRVDVDVRHHGTIDLRGALAEARGRVLDARAERLADGELADGELADGELADGARG